jgi:hypothetical protein
MIRRRIIVGNLDGVDIVVDSISELIDAVHPEMVHQSWFRRRNRKSQPGSRAIHWLIMNGGIKPVYVIHFNILIYILIQNSIF